MDNSLKKILLAFGLLIVVIFIFQKNKREPINWNESYSISDKNPYGLYILDQEIDYLFKNKNIEHTGPNLYDFISDYLDYSDEVKASQTEHAQEKDVSNEYESEYIQSWDYRNFKEDFLNKTSIISIQNQSYMDTYLLANIMEYVANGNTIVMFETLQDYYDEENFQLPIKANYYPNSSTKSISLTNNTITKQRFAIENLNNQYFTVSDSIVNKVRVLGYKYFDDGVKLPNLIEYKYGKGKLILGTDPIIFTNYNLLKSNNHLYIEGVLSYLPSENYTYFMTDKDYDNLYGEKDQPLLSFILKNEELRWAWYFCFITLGLFVLFTVKRKQRIIPIISPLTNTTIEFTKTVSSLYIQNKDYSDAMHKSIIYTLEKLRRLYWIDTSQLDDKFVESMHIKTNKNKEDIIAYVNFVNAFKNAKHPAGEGDLIRLNNLTDKIID
ncbi:hypothetical protein [Myroides pelagicus]|uniref:DUF4350 domain-containing protein n=1 Tax=Myroides pelagicus TaxID=270914 RepID=A0A7K1GNP8_9FLAO|nr:hypothetical protein [Myroides pelagicus]MEC4114694.1 hypothetical protein [Myroides pelagicus]MTH30466.1 hypothetical protein [Myroides pelagicus]